MYEFFLDEDMMTKGKPEYYFTIGQRSSVKLVYQNYHFVKFLENSRGTKWICSTRSTTRCKARLRIDRDQVLQVLYGDHNHNSNGELKRRKFIRKTTTRPICDNSRENNSKNSTNLANNDLNMTINNDSNSF